MRRSIIGFGVLAGTSLLCLGGISQAADVPLDKVPKVVMDAAQARFEGAKPKGAALEKTAEGVEIYELSLDNKGMNVDVTLTPQGEIAIIKSQITRKELPKEITATLESKYPKAKYRLIETFVEVKEKEEKLTNYEVLVITADKQMRAVQLGLDGKIIHEEKQSADSDD